MEMRRFLCYVGVLVNILGWSHQAVPNQTFPADFKIGIASSAYQIEGGWNESGKGLSIWDTYVHERNYIIDHSNGDKAADSYHLYKEDVKALKELGVDFYRFSISWSRILPTGHIHIINQPGIDYYKGLISELTANKIEPVIAMYNWDLPQVLQDLGGWANPIMADYFEDYARLLYKTFGDKVKTWITINDPHSIAYGYSEPETYAPGLNATGLGYYLAVHTLLQAHGRAYHVYDDEFRSTQKGQIGIALNGEWYEPKTNSTQDKQAAELGMQFVLGLFANPIYSSKGDYPEEVKKQVDKISTAEGYQRSRLRKFSPKDIGTLRGSADFLGLNYYTSRLARAPEQTTDLKNVPDINVIFSQIPNWPDSGAPFYEVVPWGFRKLLNWIKDNYKNVPVIITQNGFADRGETEDTERIKFFVSHMSEMLKAIRQDGCKVTAYTFWSLLDGFEWDLGYTLKFGMYHVNYSNPQLPRTQKRSAYVFSEITRKRELPAHFMQITGEVPAGANNTASPAAGSANCTNCTQSSTTRRPSSAASYSGTLLCVWLAAIVISNQVVTK